MFKKIMFTLVLYLIATPAIVSYAASGDGFISETESKLMTHEFRWGVIVYRLNDGEKEKIFDETLDRAIAQKDGSYLSSSEKFTVLESKDVIILRTNNIEVGNKKYSETLTYEKGDIMSYSQKNSDSSLLIELRIRPSNNVTKHDDKPNHVFY